MNDIYDDCHETGAIGAAIGATADPTYVLTKHVAIALVATSIIALTNSTIDVFIGSGSEMRCYKS